MSLEEAECEDARIEYISNITRLTLDLNEKLWTEMVWVEDNQHIIKDFLDTPATKLLFIYVDTKGKLAVTTEFPKKRPMPTKSIYFLKYADGAIPLSNFKQHFMRGTLVAEPLKHYQAIYEQVFTPILCNHDNNSKWPEYFVDDIIAHVQEFRNTVYFSLGQAKGRTLLPIPDMAEHVTKLDVDALNSSSTSDSTVNAIINAIGEMVNNWTLLINEILKAECEQSPLDSTLLHGPMTEISFWEEHTENLKYILSQINTPTVKLMAKALEKTDSCFVRAFTKLLRDIVEAIIESEDISTHLTAMKEQINTLTDCPYAEMANILPEMMRMITASWQQSKFFRCSPSRIAILLQKICNLLISRARTYIGGSTIFSEPRSSSGEKVVLAKSIITLFVTSYDECRYDMESFFAHAKVYPWEYPDDRVFKFLRNFEVQLQVIQGLFEAANIYHLIPNFKLKALAQTLLKLRLNSIFKEFCQYYKVFEEAKYDPLTLGNVEFEKDFKTFSRCLEDLDMRLGSAISKGCAESPSAAEAFKLMEQFKFVIKRPKVYGQFRTCMHIVIKKVHHELQTSKHMHDDLLNNLAVMGYCYVYKKLTPMASTLRWAVEMKQRITIPVELLKDNAHYFTTERDADCEYEMYKHMTELLDNFTDHIFNLWANGINESVTEKINEPIVAKNDKNKFMPNYDYKLSEIISETSSISKLGIEGLPSEALVLLDNNIVMHYTRTCIARTINWYNTLDEQMTSLERALIADQWDEITATLEKGTAIKWIDAGVQDYAEHVHDMCRAVFDNIMKARDNVDEIKAMIDKWSSRPLYSRKTPDSSVDFRIHMTQEVRERYSDVKEADERLRAKLEENLKLFRCGADCKEWENYIKYLEDIMRDGLVQAIECSLKYLEEHTDPEQIKDKPFVIVYLEIDPEEGVLFSPPMANREAGSLFRCVEGVIEKIFGMGSQINLLTDDTVDYEKMLYRVDSLSRLKSTTLQHVVAATNVAQMAIQNFSRFADFWYSDVELILDEFVLYGPAVFESADEDIFDDEPPEELEEPWKETAQLEFNPPTEAEFKEQIERFEEMFHETDEIETQVDIGSWLGLDVTKFKDGLTILVRRWIIAFKQKLFELKSLGKLRKNKEEGE